MGPASVIAGEGTHMSGHRSPARKALRRLLSLLPEEVVVPICRGPLRGSRWLLGSHHEECWLGTYERECQEMFLRYVGEGDVVYDIGAYVGFYSLLAARLVGPAGRVYAIEPVPRNQALLRRHLELNRVSNVVLLGTVLAAAPGEVLFDDSRGANRGRISLCGTVRLPAESLDRLLADQVVEPPSFIKLDVEGAETEVLRGATTMLSLHRPIVLVSTHGPEVHRETVNLLAGLGYAVTAVSGEDCDASHDLIALPAHRHSLASRNSTSRAARNPKQWL